MTHDISATITGSTRLAGVVGWPVNHSRSPQIHNAWLHLARIDAVYIPYAVPPARFAPFIQGMRGTGCLGLNVTAPHKEQALGLADRASARARAAGAANLLVFQPDGALTADNTDGEGLLAAFAKQAPRFDLTARPALILGAGGAARGAAAALLQAGVPKVYILNRTRERAAGLAGALGPQVEVPQVPPALDLVRGCGTLINATPDGLEALCALGMDLAIIPPHAVVMDMAYGPVQTPFLETASRRGCLTVDGLEMLIGQARPSFTAFFGREPPPLDIRALVLGE